MSCIVASDSGSKSSISSSKPLLWIMGELLKHGFLNSWVWLFKKHTPQSEAFWMKETSYLEMFCLILLLHSCALYLSLQNLKKEKNVLNNTTWFIPKVSLLTYLYLGGGWNPQVLGQLNLESVSLPSLLSLYGISTWQPQVGWLLKYMMLHSCNGSLYSCQKLCF